MNSITHYDYFVLISGSDYPLRSAAYIEDFLDQNRGTEFLSLGKVPAPGKPIARITMTRYPSTQPIRHYAFRALAKVGLGPQRDHRAYLGSMVLYSGLQWWALSREACTYAVLCADAKERMVEFFEKSFAPDESFFQTILGNSDFRNRVQRFPIYLDWPIDRPRMMGEEHVAFFESQKDGVYREDAYGRSEALFARKFSDDQPALLDRVDALIENRA
jgi:hypothetical protein